MLVFAPNPLLHAGRIRTHLDLRFLRRRRNIRCRSSAENRSRKPHGRIDRRHPYYYGLLFTHKFIVEPSPKPWRTQGLRGSIAGPGSGGVRHRRNRPDAPRLHHSDPGITYGRTSKCAGDPPNGRDMSINKAGQIASMPHCSAPTGMPLICSRGTAAPRGSTEWTVCADARMAAKSARCADPVKRWVTCQRTAAFVPCFGNPRSRLKHRCLAGYDAVVTATQVCIDPMPNRPWTHSRMFFHY